MQQQPLPIPLLMPISAPGFLPNAHMMTPQQAQQLGARVGPPDAFLPLTPQQLQQLQASAMAGNVMVGSPAVMVGGLSQPVPSPKGAKPVARGPAPKPSSHASPFMSPPNPMFNPPPPPPPKESEAPEGGGYSDPLINGLMQLMAKNGWRVEVRPGEGKEGGDVGKAKPAPQPPPPPPPSGPQPSPPQSGLPGMQGLPNPPLTPTNMKPPLPPMGSAPPAPPKRAPTPQSSQPPPPPGPQPFQMAFGMPSPSPQNDPSKPQGKGAAPTKAPARPHSDPAQAQLPMMVDPLLLEAARNGWPMEMMRSMGFGAGMGGLTMDSDMSEAAKTDLLNRAAITNAWMSLTDPGQPYGGQIPQRMPTPPIGSSPSPSPKAKGPPEPKREALRDKRPSQQGLPSMHMQQPPPPGMPPVMVGANMGNLMSQLPGTSPMMPPSPLWGSPMGPSLQGIPPGSIIIPQTSPVLVPQPTRPGSTTPKNAPKKAPPPLPPTPSHLGGMPPLGDLLADLPTEVLKAMPPHVAEALAQDPHNVRPEMYSEILQALQQTTPKTPGEGEARWPEPGPAGEEAEGEVGRPPSSSPLYTLKRHESESKGRAGPSKPSLAEMKGNREDFDTAGTLDGGSFSEGSPKEFRAARDELFGLDTEPASGDKPLVAGFTPTRGKYKMAMKMTQPLGIVQCSLPGVSKGFGAGRGKRIPA